MRGLTESRILQGIGGALAGVVLTLLLLPLLPRPEAVRHSFPRGVAENGGALEVVALHYTVDAAEWILPTYVDLLRVLPPSLRVLVAVPDASAFNDLQSRLAEAGVQRTLEAVVTGRPITPWSRDRYTLARSGDRWLLVVPQASDGGGQLRLNDWLVPWDLAAVFPATDVVALPLRFDAGDLLVTNTHVLASYRLLEKNLGSLVHSEGELVDLLQDALGLPVVVFGNGRGEVPSHHVGMYLTALPDGRLMVGDPALGLAHLDPGQAERLGADTSETVRRQLDAVASGLQAAGLQVVRVPIVPLAGELDYLTYNNALVEQRDGRTVAYVPVYGIEALDAAGLAAWRALGAEVHPIDASAVYRQHGSVHCLVNVLRRGDVTAENSALALLLSR